MSVWKLILRVCVGAGMFGYLLFKHGVDLYEVFDKVRQVPPGYVFGALALYASGQLLCAYRWGGLSALAGNKVSFERVSTVYFSGMFFNMCLPTSIGGDVVRVVGLSRQTGSKTKALASVFMDRNIGLSALLCIGLAASVISSACIDVKILGRHPVWPLFALLLPAYLVANTVLFSAAFCAAVTRFSEQFRIGFVGRKVEKLHASLQAYKKPLGQYAFMFLYSFIYQISEITVVCLLARGLGIDVSAWVFFALVPFQALACLLPITFSGVGVREAIFCAVLKGQLGDLPQVRSEAMALSLIFFGVVVLASLAGGVVYMASGMPRPSIAETGAMAKAGE